MRVLVRAFATLREHLPVEAAVEVPGQGTVRDLLRSLMAKQPALHDEICAGPGGLSEEVNILLNGRNIAFLQGLSTPLGEGDVVALFPSLGGG